MQAQMAAGNQITSERNHSLQDEYYYSTDLLNSVVMRSNLHRLFKNKHLFLLKHFCQ